MRKNYFAKKFIAYSMAFAVAFSTLTVSPVFVKEAKAETVVAAYQADFTAATMPTEKKLTNGSIIIESMESDNVAGTLITTNIFGSKANLDGTKIVLPRIEQKTEQTYTLKGTTGPGAEGVNSTPKELDMSKNLTDKIQLTATAAGKWFKLNDVSGEFLTGKDTVTYKYYTLSELTNTNVATYELKKSLSNLGLYICADATDGTIKGFFNVIEKTDLKAGNVKKETFAQVGQKAILSVQAQNNGTKPISYSWTKDGKAISNTSADLVINSVTEDDFGTYKCIVSDGVANVPVSQELSETAFNKVNANATTIQSYANVLVAVDGPKYKLDKEEVKLTTNIESGDYKYIWTDENDDPVTLSEANTIGYNPTNKNITISSAADTFKIDGTSKFICYAVPTVKYNSTDDIETALNKFAKADTTAKKTDAIAELRTAEVTLAQTSKVFKEVFTLNLKTDASKFKANVQSVNVGQTLVLDAPEIETEKTLKYKWTLADGTTVLDGTTDDLITNKLTIDTVDVADLGTIKCEVFECGVAHGEDKDCLNDSDNCGTYTTKVVTNLYNIVYKSDLIASGNDVNAKEGEKNVVLNVTASATLPYDISWYKPNHALPITNAKANTYTIYKVAAGDFFTVAGKEQYVCVVTDGIKKVEVPIRVNKIDTFNVYKDQTDYKNGTAMTDKQTKTLAYAGLKGENIKLSPIVVTANDEIAKTISYKWTKDAVDGEVVSTDKEYTVAYPDSAEIYILTITDGIKTAYIQYTISQVKVSDLVTTATFKAYAEESLTYTGKELNPVSVIATYNGSTMNLKQGVDFTVDLKENVNVGIGFYSNIKLIGEYAKVAAEKFANDGSVIGKFYITRADNKLEIADKTVMLGQSVQPTTVTNLSKGTLTYTYYADADCTTEIEVPNKVGTYYVKATSVATANYNEATSNVATIKIIGLGKTKIGSTSRTASSVKLPWTKVEGATKYRVYKKAAGASSYTKVADTTALSYNVTGLASATTYTFAVKAYGEGGWATVYATKITTTAPAKVSTPVVTAKGSGKVAISYNKVARATGYQIYMAKGNGSYKKIAQGSKTAITKARLAKGATYKFKVRAYKTVGSNTYYGAFSSAKAVKVK